MTYHMLVRAAIDIVSKKLIMCARNLITPHGMVTCMQLTTSEDTTQ